MDGSKCLVELRRDDKGTRQIPFEKTSVVGFLMQGEGRLSFQAPTLS